MKTIPTIRLRLHALADRITDPELAAELHALADETKRKPSKRPHVPRQRQGLSPEVKRAVRTFAADPANRHVGLLEMARRFNTNQGRISEVINGRRDD
ncbi:hypothetical protein I6F35_06530 [Bradyrhizobium sp. BRP22]|uniref:hypothetical protein n=1 Tax=Bradyrhizobium sp. BRP22 TaxID=2793821 RepID=UPI001CD598A3|nr:hypothetical protein [Bradyrhizobium sp. BRP22]MCA1452877.1 hypothetical protein [Bradyrhizobium sp. BRP22]